MMNNINTYLQEKLIINKNIKNYNIDINIDKNNSHFSDEEIDQIINFAYNLPIRPLHITDSILIEGDGTHRPGQINLIFDNRKKTEKTNYHLHNLIRFRKDIDPKKAEYYVRVMMIDINDSKIFPPDFDYFTNIKECFKCINEQWDKLELEEHFKKYYE